ncbi:hypothetical protein GCM10018953_66610 [Streptosporangium nondiastaticum]|uniref:CGNR zinc finger domain-containing protein n=1 Tax=Streptosporangium nondiastaticum TaxID=35764 RepID=UPI0031F822C3
MREYAETGLVALDLANTWDEYLDVPERLPSVEALALFCRALSIPALAPPTPADLAEARETRARLREILATAPAGRAAALAAWAGTLPLRPAITVADGLPLLRPAPAEDRLSVLLAARAIDDLLSLATSGEWERLRLCAATPCRDAFLDRSRPGRRLFCSTRCANRAHAAVSRARRR